MNAGSGGVVCRRIVRAIVVSLLFLLAAPAVAQPSGAQLAIASLPRGVEAAAGRFTVWANYASAAGGHVPVYLVNRTATPITLDAQDGNPYLVRDVEIDGRWVRAEPFLFSDCGLSYHTLRIDPDHYVRVSAIAPGAGEPARVRYRLARRSAPAVSNIGSGRFSREAARAAAQDELAMQSADVRAIEAALFGTPPLSRREREMAFRRLGELPAADAMPLLLRVLGDPSRSEEDLDLAIRVASALDPALLARHVLGVIDRAPPRLRRLTLSSLRFVTLADDALHARLLALATRAREPELGYVLPLIAQTRRPDARAALIAIAADARYSARDRIHARYQLEQWFATSSVGVIAQPIGNYSDGHRIPVRMTVRLTNTTGRSIDFRYSQLTDFLTLYVTREQGRDREFLEPRPSVRWLTTPGATSTAVHLAPGAEQTFSFDLLDYFDLPTDRGSAVTVWVSARIPGVHGEIPQLGGGGSGVNVQP